MAKVVTCKVIIETPYGILLVKDNIDRQKRYSLPGGNWEKHEGRFFKAAVRELWEELKLVVRWGKIEHLYHHTGASRGGKPTEIHVFAAQVRNGRVSRRKLSAHHFDKEVGGT